MLSSVLLLAAVSVSSPSLAQSLGPTLTRIQETGTIRVGHRLSSSPFSFLDESGQPVGYSVELCQEIVDEVEDTLGLDELQVEYVQMDTQTRIPLVQDGSVDLGCGSATNNLTRQQEVDYTHITYVTGVKLLVKVESGIEGLVDMEGRAIGVLPGTTTEKVIAEALDRRSIDATVYNQLQDHDEGFLALQENLIDAYVTDDVLLFGLRANAALPEEYDVVGEYLSYEPYGIMLRRDDSEFRLVANRRLSQLFRSGDINRVYRKWFYPLGITMTNLMESAVNLQALPE